MDSGRVTFILDFGVFSGATLVTWERCLSTIVEFARLVEESQKGIHCGEAKVEWITLKVEVLSF